MDSIWFVSVSTYEFSSSDSGLWDGKKFISQGRCFDCSFKAGSQILSSRENWVNHPPIRPLLGA